MTGRTKEAPIRTRNARLSRTLKPRPEPYWRDIAPGRHLGYRKLAGNRDGSWIARDYRGGKQYRFKRLGGADDSRPADGTSILNYQQAEALARQWFAANDSAALSDEGLHAGPYTVADAMREYFAHPQVSDANPPGSQENKTSRAPVPHNRCTLAATVMV